MARYFIAIIPPEPLASEIYGIKKTVAEKYNSKGALRSPAHITLHMPFDLEGKKEQSFLNEIKELGKGLRNFDVKLNNFSSFEPRVIFIAVEQNEELQKLQKHVVEWMKRNFSIFNQSDDVRGFHPHVTIAFRDLKKPMFYEAMKEFTHKTYQAEFTCKALSVLILDEQGWKELIRVPFE